MGRFLLAWEYGEDLGHLRRILPIGRALHERGHSVTFAFRDATKLGFASAHGFAAWPAPIVPQPRACNPRPANAADVMLNLGFDDADAIRGALRGWHALFDSAQPDAVVADYAPGALLAAHSRGLRRATVGSGFALPPRTTPLCAIREGAATDAASRAALDARLLQAITTATRNDAFDLHQLFRGATNLLTTLPELDPLGPRDEEYVGPVGAGGDGLRVSWTTAATPRVFAYLKPRDARFDAVLAALDACAGEALVAAPGLRSSTPHPHAGPRVRVLAQPLELRSLLDDAQLCIGHGGAGFACAALLAGMPLVLLPMHLEQERVALRLREQGVAVLATQPDEVRPAIEAALADANLRERARAFGERHRRARDDDLPANVAARLERLLG